MFIHKHPRLMSDPELCDSVKSLLQRQAPESKYLDYKAKISIESQAERIELGKDVSSFANEYGGILLYGVPEQEKDGVPIPKNLSECGIEIFHDLPENIENILLDIIEPLLPELYIKVLNVKDLAPKSLLMIYHPESWNKPHMVEGYKHARYYRRGNFRSVVMDEKQVEAAYLSRRLSLSYSDTFFKTGNFGIIPEKGRFFQAIICPRFTLFRKEEMLEGGFKQWLDENTPNNRRGNWIPFLDGWRFLSYADGNLHGNQFELRLFHNGPICFNMDLSRAIDEQGLLDLKSMETDFQSMVFPYANKAFECLKISGPLSTQVNLYNVKTLNAKISSENWNSTPKSGTTPIDTDKISFVEEMSVSELAISTDKVLIRLTERLASVFGLWRK